MVEKRPASTRRGRNPTGMHRTFAGWGRGDVRIRRPRGTSLGSKRVESGSPSPLSYLGYLGPTHYRSPYENTMGCCPHFPSRLHALTSTQTATSLWKIQIATLGHCGNQSYQLLFLFRSFRLEGCTDSWHSFCHFLCIAGTAVQDEALKVEMTARKTNSLINLKQFLKAEVIGTPISVLIQFPRMHAILHSFQVYCFRNLEAKSLRWLGEASRQIFFQLLILFTVRKYIRGLFI